MKPCLSISRREFIAALAAVPALGSVRPSAGRPSWLKDGIVLVGNWEPPTFFTRRGGEAEDYREQWLQERSESSIRKLKEAGVNVVLTNLHKGFGLKAEAAEIEATREYTRLAHRYGIRVGGYIGGTIMFETFFDEEPDAVNWGQRDEFGNPIYYGWDQTFRYVACRNNPGYHAFVLKVIRLGIEEIKLDLIHFDQLTGWPEPRSCRCNHCVAGFRAFLESRYDEQTRKRRFGFARFDNVIPPPFGTVESFREVRNPILQEWALFRAATVTRRFAEYDDYIRSLNPEVAVEGNPNVNLAQNQGYTQGVDMAHLLEHGDIVWSEEPNSAAWHEGRLISKVRSFKSARIMGKSIFMYTGGRYGPKSPASPPELLIAEAMAFNGANIGMVGDMAAGGVELTEAARRYVRFFRNHASEFAEAVSAAEVAVLRSFPAIEFNPAACNVSTVLFEQALLQSQVPFDIVFNRHLAVIGRYKVLVLANQDALGNSELDEIRRFVAAGGGLVATDETSMRNEWRQMRGVYGLADLFGFDRPPGRAVRREAGNGRVAFIPQVVPSIPPPLAQATYDFSNKYWAVPENVGELPGAVRWSAREGLSLQVEAPGSVAVEAVRIPAKEQTMLHLVNFDAADAARAVAVHFRPPSGWTVRQVAFETPDESGAATVKHEAAGVRITIPTLRTYGLLRMQLVKS